MATVNYDNATLEQQRFMRKLTRYDYTRQEFTTGTDHHHLTRRGIFYCDVLLADCPGEPDCCGCGGPLPCDYAGCLEQRSNEGQGNMPDHETWWEYMDCDICQGDETHTEAEARMAAEAKARHALCCGYEG